MAKNTNLRKAKSTKNDEFYTQMTDVEKELKHYRNHFKDKVIYCNCDDNESAFWKYFHLNFELFGLKKLVATHYSSTDPTYKIEYCGGNDTDTESGEITQLLCNGDFRSDESIEILKESDIVVTNPPFSLFREYVAQLMEYEKKFIIIGNFNAVTYKEIFPLIKDNKLWLGYGGNIPMTFRKPDYYEIKGSDFMGEDGHKYAKMGSCAWFTNLDIKKRHDNIVLYQRYYDDNGNPLPGIEKKYPKYDNYDAINVDKVTDIPCDYFGVMGVPITFLDKYNPDQFEIINGIGRYSILDNEKTKADGKYLSMINGEARYFRIIIRKKNRYMVWIR